MSEVTAVPLRPVGKSGVAALWIGVAVLIAAGIGGAYAATETPAAAGLSAGDFMVANARHNGVVTTASGLEYKVIKAGSGDKPTAADVVKVDYRGTLVNGAEFDASKPGQPLISPVAQLVPGFSEALQLMPRGSVYRVWIPPQLAYGDQPAGPIPPNSVLVFDLTMEDFQALPPGALQGAGGIPGEATQGQPQR